MRNQEIADQLVISLTSVKRHTGNTYRKLGVEHRTEAVAQLTTRVCFRRSIKPNYTLEVHPICTLRLRAALAPTLSVAVGVRRTAVASEGRLQSMSSADVSTRRQHEFDVHELRVQGHLDERWADWLEGLTLTHEDDDTTTLAGPLADEAALHGVLNRIRDLALPIVSVLCISPDGQKAI